MIDLHIHTNCSDGVLTPKEIIDEAYKNGINTIAICDHDTTEAYQEEIFNYAKEKNINLIVGVEISTKAKKYGVHVLGYNFDLNNKEFQEKLYTIRNARHIYLRKVATKLEEAGYKIDVERLDKIDAVSKAHIAYDVIENKENESKLKEVFGHIPDMGEFIETIMNEDCPCYVRKETISPKEASELIHNAGGKVVLAHPVAYTYEDNLTEKDVDDSSNYLNKWKYIVPKSPIAGQTDFSKPVAFYYDGNTKIAKPGECCTESFIVLGAFDTEEEVKSFKSYILTKTVRFLLLQTVVSQDVTKKNYCFVPDINNYTRIFDDEYLCKLWGITQEEWNYIDSRIGNIER